MFKKPFRIKSQTVMKGSDRKKLRVEITKAFGELSPDAAVDIIPNKEEVTIVKIYTHAGDNTFIYCVNKVPVLFEIVKQRVIYPTVYLLWKYPDLIARFTTWPPVFKKLTDGADLMLPGVIVREQLTPHTFKHIQKGQTCSVNIVGNRAPVGVGCTLLSGSDFYDAGMKGKGIHPLHLLGDELWAYGDKCLPPDLGDDPLPQELLDEMEGVDNKVMGSDEERLQDESNGHRETTRQEVSAGETDGACGGDSTELPNMQNLALGADNVGEANGECTEPVDQVDTSAEVVTTPEQMDELLHFCFLCSMKASVKKTDLPLNTGTFYKSHMMRFCPEDKNLDIKKSTYKKLSKFLNKQEKTGIIKLKELSKGVDSIVEMDRSHLLLRGFEAPEPTDLGTSMPSEQEYQPPQITEMFAVTSNVLHLFKQLGYSKGSALKSQDVRNAVKDYVKNNNLQDENSKSDVQLDPHLAEILLTRAEGDRPTLKWDEVFSRLLNKMSPVHEILFPGQPPTIRKGNVDPIKIDVVQRASNKKATVVENLDMFGIDPKEFAHIVQVKVACSASVNPSQQKNKGPHVVVQGNQINYVAELLNNTYKIPRKYLKGLEKAPKSKHR